jgi:glycosyltransferase involved in cell wall biosynthesis
MRISAFLPHLGVFGGVRRYLELGNAWIAQGHEVTLFHPQGTAPEWLRFRGATAPLSSASSVPGDLAFCGDPHTFPAFRAHPASLHIYYCVLERDPGLLAAIADTRVVLAANSSRLRAQVARQAGRPVLDGIGGIDPARFHPPARGRPDAPFRVMVNGRRSRPKKGTDLVLAALRGLDRKFAFETVLFDSLDPNRREDPRLGARVPRRTRWVLNPSQEELLALYQTSHIFVAAERKAGWCNTALEAMACGCAVVCTRSGTTDFAHDGQTALVTWRHPWFLKRAIARLIRDAELRERLSRAGPAAATPWSWDRLARKLIDQVEPLRAGPDSAGAPKVTAAAG